VADSEIFAKLKEVHAELAKAAAKSDVSCVWCGDYGIEPQMMLRDLDSDPNLGWRTASAAMLHDDPWTSVSNHNHGKATDAILYGDGLDVLGVLGGLPTLVSQTALLQSGYPSDHLLQLAVLAYAKKGQANGDSKNSHKRESDCESDAWCSSSSSSSISTPDRPPSAPAAAAAVVND